MAVRQITVSDNSGRELTDDDHVRVVVEHPDHAVALELDVSVAEADRLQDSTLRLVTCTILAPARPPRRAVVETKTLDKLFEGVDFDRVLEGARASERRGLARDDAAPRRAAAAPGPSKTDYSAPDAAGILHRGRVTEAEAAWVRANLDAANANRARVGQPPIDPADPKEQQRYGL
jgi:hypothetical protein